MLLQLSGGDVEREDNVLKVEKHLEPIVENLKESELLPFVVEFYEPLSLRLKNY
jgi:hypothetical protein